MHTDTLNAESATGLREGYPNRVVINLKKTNETINSPSGKMINSPNGKGDN